MNVCWIGLYPVFSFAADLKSKMTAVRPCEMFFFLRDHKAYWIQTIHELSFGSHVDILCFRCYSEIQDGFNCRHNLAYYS